MSSARQTTCAQRQLLLPYVGRVPLFVILSKTVMNILADSGVYRDCHSLLIVEETKSRRNDLPRRPVGRDLREWGELTSSAPRDPEHSPRDPVKARPTPESLAFTSFERRASRGNGDASNLSLPISFRSHCLAGPSSSLKADDI